MAWGRCDASKAQNWRTMNDVELPVARPVRRPPTHPGELMREILDEHFRLPVATAAERMGVSRQSLYAVLRGASAVSADMAIRFAELTDSEPELYVLMQAKHDLWHAQQRRAAAG
jgi:addiction module HigA family antidote